MAGRRIAGATLEYVVRATNIGTVPAYAVVIRDDLAVPTPGYLTFVNGSYTMNGSTDGITVVGLAADRRLLDDLWRARSQGRTITLRFRAVLNANLAIGTRVTNTGRVYWNDPPQTCERERLHRRRRHGRRRHPERPRVARCQLQQGGRCHGTRARRLDRRALSKRPSRVLGDHGCDRYLSHQRRHT